MGKKDILLKDYFTPDIFSDAINTIVFDGKIVVTPNRMHSLDIETQHIEENATKVDTRYRDIAKVAEVDNAIYCLFAIENQSVEDYSMPLRIMEYDVREYLRQIKNCQKKLTSIKPIITIVMYWKPDKWCYPTNIKDMYDTDTVRWLEKYGLSEYIQDYRMHLFEPATVSDKVLNRFRTEIKDVIAYVKYSKSTDALREYNEKNKPNLTRKTVTLINELTNSDYHFIEGKETLNMCEAFEGIKAEGLKEGIKEGIKEGVEIGEYNIIIQAANNMGSKGMTAAEIAANLGITEEKLSEALKSAYEKDK